MPEMRRRTRRSTAPTAVAVATAALAAGQLSAQEPEVLAYLEPAEVEIGEPFRVIVEISGVKEVEDVFIPPVYALAGHRHERLLPFTTEIATPEPGQAGGLVTFAYSFVARAAGSVEIGPAMVTAGGRSFETELLTLVVKDPPNVTVRAWIEPAEVRVMEEFTVNVEVAGVEYLLELPEVPDLSDFAAGTSSGGGAATARFGFVALKSGTHEIDPISVKVGSNVYNTEPLTLVVDGGPRAIQAHASTNTEQAWVGGDFHLVVEVEGVEELDEPPSLPDMSDFAELLDDDTNGTTFSSSGGGFFEDYRFRALTPGDFEIGPVRIMAVGQTIMTEPILLTIAHPPEEPVVSSEDLRFIATADKLRAYVGEPVVVSYRMFSRSWGGIPGGSNWDVQYDTLGLPLHEDFRVQKLDPHFGKRERVTLDSRLYGASGEDRAAFVPLAPGKRTIGPAEFKVQIRRETQSLRRRLVEGGRARWMGTWTPMVLVTDPIAIEVLPLPAEGRPKSFGGYVGRVGLVAWVDRTDAAVGDTVTLHVELSSGTHSSLMPTPQIVFPDGFEVSEPEISHSNPRTDDEGSNSTRLYVHRLIAKQEGTYQIPAFEVSYFDPVSESYGISRVGPFDLVVVSAAKGAGQ